MNTITRLRKMQACQPAIDWVAAQQDQSIEALWETCKVGEWGLWLAAELRVPIPDAAIRPALLRLLRVYVPRELRAAGLVAQAERLENLPDDVDWKEAAAEAEAAEAEAEAAAWAAEAAEAAWAAAWAEEAARAAARWAPDPEAERARCADEVRAAMGSTVVEAWNTSGGEP